MMIRLLFLFCVFCGVLAKSGQEKCKLTDSPCMLRMATEIHASFFTNEGLDPIHVEALDIHLPNMHYNISDTTMTGFKDCDVEYINIDFDLIVFDISFLCPGLHMEGNYAGEGYFKQFHVVGSGNYTIDTSLYRYKDHMKINLVRKNGQTFMHLTDSQIDLDPVEPVKTQLNNLYNGDKERGARVNKYINEHWRDFIKDSEMPMFQYYVRKMLQVVNLFFENHAIEDFVVL